MSYTIAFARSLTAQGFGIVALSAFLLNSVESFAAPVYFPGTQHYYELVKSFSYWETAKVAAQQRTFSGVNGYLASINSVSENSFLVSSFAGAMETQFQVWVGGYQPLGSPEPAGNWRWTSGETWSYSNWSGGQPNNGGGSENYLVLYLQPNLWGAVGTWGDASNSERSMWYVVEYAVPEPSSGVLILLGGLLAMLRQTKR